MLIVLQGPRNDQKYQQILNYIKGYGFNLHEVIQRCQGRYTPEQCRNILHLMAQRYLFQERNVVIHDEFPTAKSISSLVMFADAKGCKIEFIRSSDATGEQLSFLECFAC